ncbi:MAG TPA: 1,2-phenylacetyl-CoA epoxidase subunit PaaD [Gemmatimonadaceae bacterium]|nr:1,2-phenylacetyl-CoA epoxidase subunit PaaD [Gemmatimonadaceae bacterium]
MRGPVSKEEILQILTEVKDPELPMIDVVELGIVRDVVMDANAIRVDVTPTYSGCPAMQVIEREILSTLDAHGYSGATVRTVYSPAWTTDWISDATKQKLREFGIAPPRMVESAGGGIAELVNLRRARPSMECPFCGSANTTERSEFGSTACKAIHFCNSCHQPFDHFKAF